MYRECDQQCGDVDPENRRPVARRSRGRQILRPNQFLLWVQRGLDQLLKQLTARRALLIADMGENLSAGPRRRRHRDGGAFDFFATRAFYTLGVDWASQSLFCQARSRGFMPPLTTRTEPADVRSTSLPRHHRNARFALHQKINFAMREILLFPLVASKLPALYLLHTRYSLGFDGILCCAIDSFGLRPGRVRHFSCNR